MIKEVIIHNLEDPLRGRRVRSKNAWDGFSPKIKAHRGAHNRFEFG
jgi:hypothetical protein